MGAALRILMALLGGVALGAALRAFAPDSLPLLQSIADPVGGLRKLGFRSTPVTGGCVKFVHDAFGTVLWLPATGRLDVIVPYAVPRERRVTAARAIATIVERATLGAS